MYDVFHLFSLVFTKILSMARQYFQPTLQTTGAELWHASPYEFDRFSSGFIGTGEGAAAFGHGLYFAESETVADNYCTVFGRKFFYSQISYCGAILADARIEEVFPFLPEANRRVIDDVMRFLGCKNYELRQAFEYVRMDYEAMAYGAFGKRLKKARELKKAFRQMRQLFQVPPETTTFKYKVRSRARQYFNWDRVIGLPIGQKIVRQLQKERINLNTVKSHFDNAAKFHWSNITGGQFYAGLADFLGSKVSASGFLSRTGFDGIKYLDGFSRTGEETEVNTYNYVVFDESLVEIAEKFEIKVYSKTSH